MDYDANDGYVVLLFGGNSIALVATWKFSAGSWAQLFPASNPPARQFYSLVFDAQTNYVLIFGGSRLTPESSSLDTLWAYGNQNWVVDAVANPLPAQLAPPARAGAAMAYDPDLNAVVLVAGCSAQCLTLTGGTWIYQNGHWTGLQSSGFPYPTLFDPSLAYDPAGPYLLLFGGFVPPTSLLDQTWIFQNQHWRFLTSSGPSNRFNAAMAYNTHDSEILLFGGCNAPSPNYMDRCTQPLSDTWVFNAQGWRQVAAAGPVARAGAGMVYDPSQSGILLIGGFGGSAPNLGPLGDEWLFVGGAWYIVPGSLPFAPRWDMGVAYDSWDQKVVLLGGFGLVNGNWVTFNDTWTETQSTKWALGTGTAFGGAGRGDVAFAFDPNAGAVGYVLLFGGATTVPGPFFAPGQGETWNYIGATGWVALSFVA
ncbi:MAG: kelch motif-containing protein [Thermoplasmata archaeon]|nr:kelch motif-containing protein [Thermoplasmata archaeon]